MTEKLGWILFILAFVLMFCGWTWFGCGLLLYSFANFLLDVAAADAQDEINRKYEDERFARLYPEEYKNEQVRVANKKLEWKKPKKSCSG